MSPDDVASDAAAPRGLSVELLAPGAKGGEAKVGASLGLVLSFHNEGDGAVSHPISTQTVRLVAVLPNGDRQDLAVQWSATQVALDPGALLAAFGRLTLEDPGTYQLLLWWTPDGQAPDGEPTSTLELTASSDPG